MQRAEDCCFMPGPGLAYMLHLTYLLLKAKSPASSNKKRKKLTEPDLSNPYKKMYMSKKSTPDGNKTKSGAVSVSDTLSNTRATAGSDEKSKTKKRDRKSSALLPPINNIPAKEMRAAILENSLPAALLALPSKSSQTEPPSNKISIMEAAQQRLDEANRWVASASMSVESARKHLDSVTRARNAALTAKMEATEFLRIVTAMQLQKTLNGTSADMESSQRQISVKESLAGETKDDNEPSDKRDNLLKKSSDVDDDTAETVEKSHGKVCHGFTICLDKDDSNGVAAEEHPKTTEQNSSKKTNSLPLKKRQSNIEVNGRPEGHPESLVNNTLNSDEMEDNKQKNNNSDDAIIHLKTIPAPSKQNRRFNDLTPEAKEILRKIVLSSLSKNGKIDAAAMKRATDIGIPEQAVISAVKVAWDKLRNTVADAAKNMGASVLHGIELRGLGLAEFDGVYERCLEESPYSKVDPDHPPSFQKKLTYNDQTAVFRLYHTDVPGHWEISFVDKDGKEEKKYSGAIARPKKASGGDTAKSFEREWVSVAGKVCSVTITPLYCERV